MAEERLCRVMGVVSSMEVFGCSLFGGNLKEDLFSAESIEPGSLVMTSIIWQHLNKIIVRFIWGQLLKHRLPMRCIEATCVYRGS